MGGHQNFHYCVLYVILYFEHETFTLQKVRIQKPDKNEYSGLHNAMLLYQ
jgi:hypothetical protein